MKASKLLDIIRKDLKSYPNDYLKNKVTQKKNQNPKEHSLNSSRY